MMTETRLRRPPWLALLAIAVMFTACPSTPPPSLSLTPDSSTVSAGGAAITFTATTANASEEVKWKLAGPGSISSASGLSTQYTPPAARAVSSQATAALTASLPNAGLNATAAIAIKPVAKPALGTFEIIVTGLPDGVNSSVNITGPNGFSQAVTASKTLSDLEPGSYTVSASDVTSGGVTFSATVTGSPSTVTAGQTASASVAYAAQIPGRGALNVNISGLPDGANANVTVNGPSGFTRVLTSSQTISDLEPGTYTVVPDDVTANGKTFKASLTGSPATVEAGKTAISSVTYAAQVVQPGSLAISITGLPGGLNANVTVSGPDGFSRSLPSSATLTGLEPGNYLVTASEITSNSTRFAGTVAGSPAAVKSGETAISSVSYTSQVGSLQVAVGGLPAGLNADVTVSGPGGFSQRLAASRALDGLNPGGYAINAKTVRQHLGIVDALFDAAVTGSPATVAAGGTALSSATYAQRPGTGQVWIAGNALVGYAASVLGDSGSLLPTVALPVSGNFAGVAFDANGNLWASSSNANFLVKFAAAKLAQGGAAAPDVFVTANAGSLSGPSGLAFDRDGNLWVANSGGNSNSLVKFAPAQLERSGSPTPTATITSPGNALVSPRGLAFDKDGRLWATSGPDRIVKFTPAQLASGGAATSTVIPAVTLTSNRDNGFPSIQNPTALAFDAGGNLFVGNGSGQVMSSFSPAQQAATSSPRPNLQLVDPLSGASGCVVTPAGGIAFDTGGKLWVTCSSQTTLRQFTVQSSGLQFVDSGRTIDLGKTFGSVSGLAFNPPPTDLPIAQVR